MEPIPSVRKQQVLDILTRSFASNKSANFVVKQDHKRIKRLRNLIDYAYRIAAPENGVFFNPQGQAAAICQFPGKSVPFFKQSMLNIRLAINTIGLPRVPLVLKRESYIKRRHPAYPYLYIWFIGTHPDFQSHGYGTSLLESILKYAENYNWPVYLETSTVSNIPFYEKNGFAVYHQWKFKHAGFPLYFLRYEWN